MNISKKQLFNFSLIFILLLYLTVFTSSLFEIINMWSYSQSFINYQEGFVRRGLFGTIMLFAHKHLMIHPHYFWSIFFISLNILNILIFFKLIKKYLGNYLIFIFIAFHPALLLFSFYDLGGYGRFDIISISLILIHSLLAFQVNDNKISIKKYIKYFNYLIFPILIVSILIHEMQIFTLLFHYITFKKVCENSQNTISVNYYFYFLIIIIILVFIFGNLNSEQSISIFENAKTFGIWSEPVISTSKAQTFNGYFYVFSYNVLSPYNLRIHLFFFLMSTIPFVLLFKYLKNNKFLKLKKYNFFDFIIVTIPLLSGWVIGDLGRWISLSSFSIICLIAQIPIQKGINEHTSDKNVYLFFNKYLLIFFTFIFLFFMRVPHCCDLEKNKISIWGGLLNKLIAITKVTIDTKGNYKNLDLKKFKYLDK